MDQPECRQCASAAAITDRETGEHWCLDCATALVQAGDPILDYRELAEGPMYSHRLRRLSTAVLVLR